MFRLLSPSTSLSPSNSLYSIVIYRDVRKILGGFFYSNYKYDYVN